jgi:ubiquitin C-terminal hydrolase
MKLSEKDEYEFKNYFIRNRAKNNSFIYDLFYGYQMNKIMCTACSDTQVSFQCFNILDLPLIDGDIQLKSLEQCLNCYLITKDQKGIQGFDCKKCNRNILSYSTSIIKLPQVLIINLKRVGEKYIYNHEIKIPYTFNTNSIDKLDKANKNYELIGFIKHFGNEMNGHNVAYTKNFFDYKWYSFNDSEVKQINGYPTTDKSFLLFYQLIDEESTPTPTPTPK